jgi:O-antigen ligase
VLSRISDQAYRLGLIAFAILLPLEIVPNRIISLLSLAVTLLLIQRLVVDFLSGKRLRLRTVGLVVFLPLLSYGFSALIHGISVRDTGLITLTVLSLRAWIVAQFTTKSDLKMFENASLFVALVVIAFGFYQYIGDMYLHLPESMTWLRQTYSSTGTYHFARVHSFAREPLLLANYLFIPLSYCLVAFWRKRSQLLHWIVSILGLLLILTLNSRGAYYAIALVVVVLIISAIINGKKHFTLLSTIGLAGAALLLVISKGSSFIKHAFELKDASFTNRVDAWSIGLQTFKQNLLIGVGPIRDGIYTTYPNNTIYQQQLVYDNTYMTVLAKMGVIGLASWIAVIIPLVAGALKSIKKNFEPLFSPYALIIITYLVQVSTYEALLNLRFWAVLGFAFAALRLDNEGYYEDRH